MLWIFTIVGLVTSGSILFRLVIAVRARHRSWVVEAAALAPLAVAWGAQHTSAIGWAALLLAFGIELLRWVTAPSPDSAVDRPTATAVTVGDACEPVAMATRPSDVHQPITDDPVADEPVEDVKALAANAVVSPERAPAPVGVESREGHDDRIEGRIGPAKHEQPVTLDDATATGNLVFTTFALLDAPWETAPSVFFASLRRAGRRDAELMDKGCSDEPHTSVRVRTGVVELELVGAAVPVPQDELDTARSQVPASSKSVDIRDRHVAHVRFRTECPTGTLCRDVVHLHLCAHAALAEFTPVPGVLWPAAGRLVPAADLNKPVADVDRPAHLVAACVRFRSYSSDESAHGRFVSDTVGLHAFGLPDVEIIAKGAADETVAAVVRDLAGVLFEHGCDIRDGRILSPAIDDAWEPSMETASFPPRRDVIQLRRCEPGRAVPDRLDTSRL